MSKKDWPDRTGEVQECAFCSVQGRKITHIVTEAENKSDEWDCPFCGKTNFVHMDDRSKLPAYTCLAAAIIVPIIIMIWEPLLGMAIFLLALFVAFAKTFFN